LIRLKRVSLSRDDRVGVGKGASTFLLHIDDASE
jgi:hypothetical protein